MELLLEAHTPDPLGDLGAQGVQRDALDGTKQLEVLLTGERVVCGEQQSGGEASEAFRSERERELAAGTLVRDLAVRGPTSVSHSKSCCGQTPVNWRMAAIWVAVE